jgi:diadenosine tetraphosphatase ApaH/serine/threonine PP2A family protein phosphatase
MGNHDAALVEGTAGMNAYARAAIEWTEGKLDSVQKAFLATLPISAEHGEALFVHSDASQPRHWIYVSSAAEAERSLVATQKLITFCGHVHRPQLYHMAPGKPAVCFIPSAGVGIPLARSRRWLAVLGSVGQPRDEVPSASYALFDDARGVLSYHRVPYDIETAAAKIKAAGLPAILSARLFIGR